MFLQSWARSKRRDPLTVLVVVCGLLFFVTALVYVFMHFLPSGDEPHYLVISQTLLKYHSLDVMRDYTNGDYRVFYSAPLNTQVTLNARGEVLAMHDIGAPVLWLLPFWLLGRLGAVLFIAVISVLIVVNIYKFLRTMGIGERYAFLVSLAYGIASPVYLYAHLTFVEPIGAFISLYVLRKVFQKEVHVSDLVIASTLLGILPWIHIRFAIIEIPLFFLLLYRVYRDNKFTRIRPYLLYLVPVVALFLLLEFYDYTIWGTLNPGIDQTTIGLELGLDRTTTADVVKRLEQKGYLERQINPGDRRSRQAFITREGLRVMSRLQAGMFAAQDRLLKPLPAADRRRFVELLALLVQANNQYGRASVRGI